MAGDYVPVPCALHSRLEVAVLHRERLRVLWRGPDGERHLESLRPFDLQSRAGCEFLLARDAHGGERRLRLDWILRADPA